MTDNSRVRVSIVGVVIVALFIALLARLWFLQMGAEEELRFQAVARSTRMVQTESPRGRILDRNGTCSSRTSPSGRSPSTGSSTTTTASASSASSPKSLAPQYTAEQLEENFNDLRQSPLKPAIVAVGVPGNRARRDPRAHRGLSGHQGAEADGAALPAGPARRALLGYVGEISDEQLATRRDDGYQEGETIGKDGAERAFEKDLRGEPRREKVEVDPTGQPVGAPLDVEPGTIGNDVHADDRRELAGARPSSRSQQGIESAREQQNENIKDKRFENLKAPGGAVVAMDVTDGSVVAMATLPDLRPEPVRRRHQPDRVDRR